MQGGGGGRISGIGMNSMGPAGAANMQSTNALGSKNFPVTPQNMQAMPAN
jgi:hypothetical protein